MNFTSNLSLIPTFCAAGCVIKTASCAFKIETLNNTKINILKLIFIFCSIPVNIKANLKHGIKIHALKLCEKLTSKL
jgi:hypothetical protein